MKIEKFAVIGHPIGHTMSPFIHKVLFKLSGYTIGYDVLDIENIKTEKEKLKEYDGLNITIPHKASVFSLLDQISPMAEKFGSVNTVKIEDGKFEGFTTDGEGCTTAIENSGVEIKGKVVILGSGGAARAIAFALENYDVEIIIAARDREKAEKISKEIKNSLAITIAECEKIGKIDLLINATSVGMYPKTENCVVNDEVIKNCSAVFDAVYNPHETVLIKKAKKFGKKVVYGIDMLVFQAAVAHKHWYNASFDKKDILKLCEDAAKECKRIFSVE